MRRGFPASKHTAGQELNASLKPVLTVTGSLSGRKAILELPDLSRDSGEDHWSEELRRSNTTWLSVTRELHQVTKRFRANGGDMSVAQDTLRSLSRRLERLATKPGGKAFSVSGASAATAVLVVSLHWIQTIGLSSGNAFLAALPTGLAVIIAMVCWVWLLRLLWAVLRDPDESLYARAVVLSIVVICVSMEAFAGLSTLLWQHSLIQPTVSRSASLWRSEGHYVWYLVDSIPLLSVPHTLNWQDPQPFVDHISGALLLAFKFAVIAPLVRLGFSGYQFFEKQRGRVVAMREVRREKKFAAKEKKQLEKGEMSPISTSTREGGWALLGLVITLIYAVPAVILPDTVSRINYWLTRLPPEVSIGNFHIPLQWVHAAPQLLLAVGLIVTVANFMPILHDAVNPDTVRSMRDATVAVLAYFLLLALLALTAVAISLALIHLGVAASRPQIPVASQPLATVNAYTWTIADALPGPNIPETLNWTPQYRFIDHWSEILLFTYKIIFYAILLFPMYRIIRIYAERSRYRTPVNSSLSTALKYRDCLLAVQADLNRLEETTSWRSAPENMDRLLIRVKLSLNNLEPELEKVRSLFGDTYVTDCAGDAEELARKRFKRAAMRSYSREFNSGDLRLTLNNAILKYSRSVTRALYDEGDKQLYRTKQL